MDYLKAHTPSSASYNPADVDWRELGPPHHPISFLHFIQMNREHRGSLLVCFYTRATMIRT
jgi:hypothetical protein